MEINLTIHHPYLITLASINIIVISIIIIITITVFSRNGRAASTPQDVMQHDNAFRHQNLHTIFVHSLHTKTFRAVWNNREF